jgi:hypothetical protein
MSRRSLVSTPSFAREDIRRVFSQHQTQRSSRVDSGCTATSIQQNCKKSDLSVSSQACSKSWLGWRQQQRRTTISLSSWQLATGLLWSKGLTPLVVLWFCNSVARLAAVLQ